MIYEDLSIDELKERSLELTVWDHDKITSNEFMGGIRLNLGSGKILSEIFALFSSAFYILKVVLHFLVLHSECEIDAICLDTLQFC